MIRALHLCADYIHRWFTLIYLDIDPNGKVNLLFPNLLSKFSTPGCKNHFTLLLSFKLRSHEREKKVRVSMCKQALLKRNLKTNREICKLQAESNHFGVYVQESRKIRVKHESASRAMARTVVFLDGYWKTTEIKNFFFFFFRWYLWSCRMCLFCQLLTA